MLFAFSLLRARSIMLRHLRAAIDAVSSLLFYASRFVDSYVNIMARCCWRCHAIYATLCLLSRPAAIAIIVIFAAAFFFTLRYAAAAVSILFRHFLCCYFDVSLFLR